MIYSGWPSKVKRIRFQLPPSFLLRVTHATRTHDQSSFRAFPSVCTPPPPLDMSKTTITRVRGLAFEASRASARGEYPEERRLDVAVKGRNVAGIAQAFVLWKIDRHFTCLSTEEGKSSLARFFRAIYRVEIDSIGTKGKAFPSPAMNHRFNPQRIIHRWRETASQFYNQLRKTPPRERRLSWSRERRKENR